MLIPGAVMMSVGGFALLISIAPSGWGPRKDTRPWREQEPRVSARKILHHQPSRAQRCVGGPLSGKCGRPGPRRPLALIDVNNATLPGQERLESPSLLGRPLHLGHRVDFELRASTKEEVWMREAEFGDQRLNGLIPDHRNNHQKGHDDRRSTEGWKPHPLRNGRHNIPGLRPR